MLLTSAKKQETFIIKDTINVNSETCVLTTCLETDSMESSVSTKQVHTSFAMATVVKPIANSDAETARKLPEASSLTRE